MQCKSKSNFKMGENAESLTISSKNCNHLNLVKLQKNKIDNTITLDIISANVPSRKKKCQRNHSEVKNIFKFSFLHQLSASTPTATPYDNDNSTLPAIRVFSLFWIILLNVTTTLSYASSKVILPDQWFLTHVLQDTFMWPEILKTVFKLLQNNKFLTP